jgi:hypothetical protein
MMALDGVASFGSISYRPSCRGMIAALFSNPLYFSST